jgi:hypothetical protein
MHTHLKIRNASRKSYTQWYALTFEQLENWKDDFPELFQDMVNAIDSGNIDELWEAAELIVEDEEIRDLVEPKLSYWEIEYPGVKVQSLPSDEGTEEEFEPDFPNIGFPFKAEHHDWGVNYEVDEAALFQSETKGKLCILFYTYDSRRKYEYVVDTTKPFDLSKFSYKIEKHSDDSYSGYMTYEEYDITENWAGSGDECDGVYALYVNGKLIKSLAG